MAFCEPVVSKKSQHLQLDRQNFVHRRGPWIVSAWQKWASTEIPRTIPAGSWAFFPWELHLVGKTSDGWHHTSRPEILPLQCVMVWQDSQESSLKQRFQTLRPKFWNSRRLKKLQEDGGAGSRSSHLEPTTPLISLQSFKTWSFVPEMQ